MHIDGLTSRQVELLDFMWNDLETEEDFLNWLSCLTTEEQQEVNLLQRLVVMAAIDEDMANQKEFPIAKKMLADIGIG